MTSSANLTVPSLFDFPHHVVLVTGGATGLGEMAAQAFVQNGAKVFIASRKESELKKVLLALIILHGPPIHGSAKLMTTRPQIDSTLLVQEDASTLSPISR